MIFLIIFGTRGVTYASDRGEFFCPSCGGRRPYEQKRVRRFLTLYFLPVVPLDRLGEYVECQHCKHTFKPAVLADDGARHGTPRFEAEFYAAVKRVMVLVMMADGRIDEEEIETIRLVYGKLASRDVPRSEVDAEVQAARADGRGLRQYLSSVAANLNDPGKETVVRAAFFVAAADGRITDEESALLTELAAALEMSPAHFKGVLDELLPPGGEPPARGGGPASG
jgi:tellurite resistance protein